MVERPQGLLSRQSFLAKAEASGFVARATRLLCCSFFERVTGMGREFSQPLTRKHLGCARFGSRTLQRSTILPLPLDRHLLD
jgi:hypothetical protein